MKIDRPSGPRGPHGPSRVSKPRKTSESAFADTLREVSEVAGEAEVDASAPISGIGAVLSVQEVSGEAEERRQAVSRGEDLLDRLEEIRLALLTGRMPAARLHELARMVDAKRRQTPDEELNAVLDEIDLRVRVELAKLGQIETLS